MISNTDTTNNSQIQAIILTGGQGSRLGGQDKGLIEVNGKRLIDYACDSIKEQVSHIIISANRHQDIYRQSGFDVIEDSIADYAGPLAGILSALQYIKKNELLFCCPVDMPVLPDHIVSDLYEQLLSQQADICCVQTDDRLQPLIALMHQRVVTDLFAYLQSGQRKVMDWINQQKLCTCIVDGNELQMININHEQDLQDFIKNQKS